MDYKYAAGFVDGEGYLGVVKVKRKACVGGYEYRPHIKIANTNREVLERFKDKFGGSICKYSEKHQSRNAKDIYVWTLTQGKVFKCLKKISKYLIVKREQSKVMLKYSKQWKNRTTRRLSDKDRKEREIIYIKLRKLNHRGKAPFKMEIIR